MNKYIPNPSDSYKLDLSNYDRPEADMGIMTFAWIYAGLATTFIVAIIFRDQIEFLKNYDLLLKASAAVTLFLSGKCCFKYIRNNNNNLRWVLAPAKIIEITEDDNGNSSVTVEFTPENSQPFRAVGDFTYPLVNAIAELKLAELPILYQPKRYTSGSYYIDLRSQNKILNTSNLKTLNK